MFSKFQIQKSNNPKGFTLIELMVVITIISVLMLIGIVIFNTTQQRGRDSRRRADINAIANALEANYNNATAQYPSAATLTFSGSQGFPADPIDSTTSTNCGGGPCFYCSRASAAACTGASTRASAYVAANTFFICGNLESAGVNAFYCRSNSQ